MTPTSNTTTEAMPCFEVENAACWKCNNPLWFDPEARRLFCPACSPVPAPVDQPTTQARG